MQSPTPAVSRSVSEGPLRRSASEPCILPITPAGSLDSPERKDTNSPQPREESIDEAIEQVPFSLARMVVNMQEYYTAELEAERQRTDELTRQNEEMMRKIGDMDKRLQMHVVLMDGFVGFMREVKQGQLAVAELEIAKQFGGVHLQEVQGLICAPVQQSVEEPPSREEICVATDEQRTVRFEEEESPHDSGIFDQLPPTPDMDTTPVRSTGRRAPKRKNPPSRPHRMAKRRTRADVRSVRLRDTTWTPINAGGRVGQDEDSDDDYYGQDDDQDYAPDLDIGDENDNNEESESDTASRRTSSTPSDPGTERPRYSVSRSVAPRFAIGPPGLQPFKYHRMPKTVALVWQEWKHGSYGNPAIEALENKYNTSWRMGTLQERKYASNYVGVRQKIVRKVEEMCEEEGITAEEACEVLDRRVDGRMQLLMTALRKGEDPLVVIPRRR